MKRHAAAVMSVWLQFIFTEYIEFLGFLWHDDSQLSFAFCADSSLIAWRNEFIFSNMTHSCQVLCGIKQEYYILIIRMMTYG